MDPSILRSRLRGSLFGLAVGDALGAPYEFKIRGSYSTAESMVESHTFMHNNKPLPAGTWSDDTSLALCLADSLNASNGFDPLDAAHRMVRWMTEGYLSAIGECFDIGIATRDALERYQIIFSQNQTPLERYLGSIDRRHSGNGSLMRLAPIPVYYHAHPAIAFQYAADQSRITHGSILAVECCQLATAHILGFTHAPPNTSAQEKKLQVLGAHFIPSGLSGMEFSTPEVNALWDGTWKEKQLDQISTSGFVVSSHEAALWALWTTSTFKEGMMQLMKMGSDVDTVCAIYGQIAGACYGMESIPSEWINSLQKPELLSRIFDLLVDTSMDKTFV